MKTKPITLIVLLLFCLSGSVFAGESDQALEVILGEGWFDKPTSLGVPMGVLFMLAMLGMMFNNNNSNAETQSEDQIKKELGEHISDSNNNIYYKNSIHYEEAKNVLDLIRKYKFSGADIQLNRLNDNYILKIIPKNLKQHMESINVPTEKKSFENLLHDLSVYCFDIRKTDIHFCDVNFTTKHIFESSEKITKVSDNSYIVTNKQIPERLISSLKEFMTKREFPGGIWMESSNNAIVITYYSSPEEYSDFNDSNYVLVANQFSLEAFNGASVNLKIHDSKTVELKFNVNSEDNRKYMPKVDNSEDNRKYMPKVDNGTKLRLRKKEY